MTRSADAQATKRADELQAAQFAGIINCAMDAIIGVDRTERITLFNPAAQRIFGYTPWEALGKPLEFLVPERIRHALGASEGSGKFRAIAYFENRSGHPTGLRSDGTEFPVQAVVSKAELGGDLSYAIILRETGRS